MHHRGALIGETAARTEGSCACPLPLAPVNVVPTHRDGTFVQHRLVPLARHVGQTAGPIRPGDAVHHSAAGPGPRPVRIPPGSRTGPAAPSTHVVDVVGGRLRRCRRLLAGWDLPSGICRKWSVVVVSAWLLGPGQRC